MNDTITSPSKNKRLKSNGSFNIARFIRTNRVIIIWVVFFSLIYILRNMFSLLFVTFILCFITNTITNKLLKSTRSGRKFWIICIYLAFVTILAGLVVFLIPRLTTEAKNFAQQLPEAVKNIHVWLDHLAEKQSELQPTINKIKESVSLENVFTGEMWGLFYKMIEKGLHYVSLFFIGLVFSFLIMLDFPGLADKVKALEYSKAGLVYRETANSVIMFAKVVGENFQAQILVSSINTILSAIGLYILGIDSIALLCSIVFFCGLIPVVGVFISSIPIMLVAMNTGGLKLVLFSILMILIIHGIEALILNPRIVSMVMRIHPVCTFFILYLGHSFLGIWGMLLGVPISVYIYRQFILGVSKEKDTVINMTELQAKEAIIVKEVPDPVSAELSKSK